MNKEEGPKVKFTHVDPVRRNYEFEFEGQKYELTGNNERVLEVHTLEGAIVGSVVGSARGGNVFLGSKYTNNLGTYTIQPDGSYLIADVITEHPLDHLMEAYDAQPAGERERPPIILEMRV